MANITIDRSESLIVLVCKTCDGTWRACAWETGEAHDRAVTHEQRTHPGTHEAERAREQWRRRGKRGKHRQGATRR